MTAEGTEMPGFRPAILLSSFILLFFLGGSQLRFLNSILCML